MQSSQTGQLSRPHIRRNRRVWIATVLSGAVLLPACGARSGPVADAIITNTAAPSTTVARPVAAETTTTTTTPPTTTVPVTAPATTVPIVETTTTTTVAPPTTVKTAQQYKTPAPAQPTPTFPNPDSNAAAVLIGKIRIPKIKVDMNLYDGVTMPVLNLGPGHWPGTAWPGEVGNTVIGGHRTSHHAVFRHVDELQPGDQIMIDDATGTHTYSVTRTQVVSPTDVWIINQSPTATITLFACHPPGSTRQRIVVFGDLVS